jgi:2-dehydropantoate 2-reductase
VKILVYGAGAVGGALAVRLASAGEDVSVVARGAHADAIRACGLTLTAGEVTRTVRVPCLTDADAVDLAPDVVFVTVKQTQLPAVARTLGRMQSAGAPLVLAMNGIGWWFADELPIPDKRAFVVELDPDGQLRDALPPKRLVGCVVQSSNEVVAPGVIVGTTPTRNRMILGDVARGGENGIPAICSVLSRAGYESFEAPDIRREIWNKMALWLAVSPISAITGLALDAIASDPAGFAVMAGVLREANAIGRKLGFDLADDVEERLGFYRDKPTRPSLVKDFELGREPELASGVTVFDVLAKAMDVDARHIATVAALARLRWRAMTTRGGALTA